MEAVVTKCGYGPCQDVPHWHMSVETGSKVHLACSVSAEQRRDDVAASDAPDFVQAVNMLSEAGFPVVGTWRRTKDGDWMISVRRKH